MTQASIRWALIAALLFGPAPAFAKKKRGRAAPAPVLESYSAYDPAQDPDADQSSTFAEPELLESLTGKTLPPAPAPIPPPLPVAKRVLQLPSAAKAAPKVTVKKLPKPAAPVVTAAAAPAKKVRPTAAPRPAPAPKSAPAPELSALESAVAHAGFASPAAAFSRRLMPKKEYAAQSCEAWRGIRDYLLNDGTVADCVTMDNAIEFAYANDWYEGLETALRHGLRSGLRPAVALILESAEDARYLEELMELRRKLRLNVEIKKVLLPDVNLARSR